MSTPPAIAKLADEWRPLLAAGRGDEMLAQVFALITQLSEANKALQLRLMKLLRTQFGRRSEKLDPAQLALLLGELATTPKEEPPATEAPLPKPEPRPRKGHGRKPLPKDLVREIVEHKVPEAERRCPTCGLEKVCIGHETSERIEFIPASFKVLVDMREKLACKPCGENVSIAPTAPKIIDSGLPGPGLLAHLTISKYKDSLPLHRLAGIYARSGVDFAVSTLADWIGATADALEPIRRRIEELALASYVVQTDDTGLKVLERDHPAGIKRGHLWVYVGDDRWAAFRYTPDWKADDPRSVLVKCRHYLQHDGYAGYPKVHEAPDGPKECACMAHARRKFIDLLKSGDIRTAYPISLIAKLYVVEKAANLAGDDADARQIRRMRDSRPVLDELGRWMADAYDKEPPKSALAGAIRYAVGRWDALRRFLDDGRIPIDNNASERALRGIAIGRKNYLFAGSDVGAERAAILYTIIGTCSLNSVEPWAYLRDVLDKLARNWPHSRLDELLPVAWAAQHKAQQQQPVPA